MYWRAGVNASIFFRYRRGKTTKIGNFIKRKKSIIAERWKTIMPPMLCQYNCILVCSYVVWKFHSLIHWKWHVWWLPCRQKCAECNDQTHGRKTTSHIAHYFQHVILMRCKFRVPVNILKLQQKVMLFKTKFCLPQYTLKLCTRNRAPCCKIGNDDTVTNSRGILQIYVRRLNTVKRTSNSIQSSQTGLDFIR